MKKLSILAIATLAMISCGNTYSAKDAELTNMNDSMNFALGLVYGVNVKYQMGKDTSDKAIAEFIDALDRGYETEDQPSKAAMTGRNLSIAVKHFEKNGLAENKVWTINEEIFFQGLVNGIYNDTTIMNIGFAYMFVQTQYQLSIIDTTTNTSEVVRGKCGNKVQSILLNCKMDSLNYAFGLLYGTEIKSNVLANDNDYTMTEELIDNINQGLEADYINPQIVNMGEEIGHSFREEEGEGLLGEKSLSVDYELIKQGFINGLYGHLNQFDAKSADKYLQNTLVFFRYSDIKEQGEKFLLENKLKEGVQVTESGLQYEVLRMGKGPRPTAESRVKVHYHGTLIDGTVFDSSVDRGEPIVFGLNQVIKGWTEGVQLMPVGSKFRFYIPQELGYGVDGHGSIPPYSVLIFEVELLDIEK